MSAPQTLRSAELFELDPSQEAAVDLLLNARIGIVTGGPGTGKTTTLRTALDRIDATPPPPRSEDDEGCARYLLAAPTGKAARRMSEATGREATTIHRLLEYGQLDGGGLGFRRNEKDPIAADLVVVDESSMIDVRLGASLMRAIDFDRTRLVLVGDADQLPSVGPGRVFADLIESGSVPVSRLSTLHRAAQDSWVCAQAPAVLAGKRPSLDTRRDFRWVHAESASEAASSTIDVVVRKLPGVGVEGAQVLVPQRTGAAGVDALNGALQSELNPRRHGARSWKRGDFELRIGDRVIQTVNDYSLDVMNGEVGAVESIGDSALAVNYDGRTVEYNAMSAGGLRLAYALTIHKSQGSEWPWVVVICHSTHSYMLSRQLLYTAITRAKKGVVIVGDEKGLDLALKNVAPSKRNTTLIERLKESEMRADAD